VGKIPSFSWERSSLAARVNEMADILMAPG
jgi:hypothetical protein